jgi:hypothetical protein
MVPEAASRGHILWLEFDGVYRSSDMWLNGALIGHHASGYTSFRFRIDNLTSFKPSATNVLAVRVDPRANEGWWYEVRSWIIWLFNPYTSFDIHRVLGYTDTHGL